VKGLKKNKEKLWTKHGGNHILGQQACDCISGGGDRVVQPVGAWANIFEIPLTVVIMYKYDWIWQ